jgi:hypothetical protein
VNLSTGSEIFLVITWSNKSKTIFRWSESRMSENGFWQPEVLVHSSIDYVTISHRRVMSGTLWCWNLRSYLHSLCLSISPSVHDLV